MKISMPKFRTSTPDSILIVYSSISDPLLPPKQLSNVVMCLQDPASLGKRVPTICPHRGASSSPSGFNTRLAAWRFPPYKTTSLLQDLRVEYLNWSIRYLSFIPIHARLAFHNGQIRNRPPLYGRQRPRPQTLSWYENDLQEVPEPAKTLLEGYSKIPSEQVVKHVNDMVSPSSHSLSSFDSSGGMLTDFQGK